MQRNIEALKAKARKCTVEHLGGGYYKVTSPSGSEYVTSVESGRCTCEWGQRWQGRKACTHLLAAKMEDDKALLMRQDSFWATKDDADRQHRHTWRCCDVYGTGRATA